MREYLTKEWLPAVKATIRPTTYNSYVQHVECHIVPHIGSVKLQKLTGSRVNALYAKLAERAKDGKSGPLPRDHPPRPCLPAQGLQGRGQVGTHLEEPLRRRRPAAQEGRRHQEMNTWTTSSSRSSLSGADDRLSPFGTRSP